MLHLKGEAQVVEKNYLQDFFSAYYTFKHQVIYDIDSCKQRYLQELPDLLEHSYYEYFGVIHRGRLAVDMAEGRVDPDTLMPFQEMIKDENKVWEAS